MRILFVGDIVGRPGRRIVRDRVPAFRRERAVDFVIANGENTAGGKGLTPPLAEELFGAGIDVLTGGNHTWRNKDVMQIIDEEPRVLRPANYPPLDDVPGRGAAVYQVPGPDQLVGVINLLGRTFMEPVDCPFRVGAECVDDLRRETPVILIDFHAEATSEKTALAWHLDGRVSAVIGTHTHVPTADENVTEAGTATLTDAGMTGPYDGVLGVRKDLIIRQMTTRLPVRHELARGDVRLCGVLIDVDAKSGRATAIERVCLRGEAG